jgi:hypothetical protein
MTTEMTTYLVWGVGSSPTGLTATDGVDNEDLARVYGLDPEFEGLAGPFTDTIGDLRWVMVVDADEAHLQALVDAGEVRGFAPRFA